MTIRILAGLAACGLLAACAYESKAPPVSSAIGRGPISQMPQSPNSLPLGSAVIAPLDFGGINTVRVGP